MADFNIYPIVAHQLGDKGTFWKTDCSFINHMHQKYDENGGLLGTEERFLDSK